jgi:hypothetical protein
MATDVDRTKDNFKPSHGNMLSEEQETVDLEGFELDWIDTLRDQVEFLNGAMKHIAFYSKCKGANL